MVPCIHLGWLQGSGDSTPLREGGPWGSISSRDVEPSRPDASEKMCLGTFQKRIRMAESRPTLRIYFDVCCLNRPFDDQRQERIRLEAEAVLLIFGRCEAGAWKWLSSAVVQEEVDNTPSRERRARVQSMLAGASGTITLTPADVERARELKAMGFRSYDALHLACAEQEPVDVFLTTDDRLLRVATRNAAQLRVRIANPLDWLLEEARA